MAKQKFYRVEEFYREAAVKWVWATSKREAIDNAINDGREWIFDGDRQIGKTIATIELDEHYQ